MYDMKRTVSRYCLTVKDLIDELSKFPQDAELLICGDTYCSIYVELLICGDTYCCIYVEQDNSVVNIDCDLLEELSE